MCPRGGHLLALCWFSSFLQAKYVVNSHLGHGWSRFGTSASLRGVQATSVVVALQKCLVRRMGGWVLSSLQLASKTNV